MKYNGHKLRHEIKYLINYRDYHVLRERLALAMKRDAFSAPDYFIRSLYFDDIKDSAYLDKLDGVANRRKFRIRTYNLGTEPIRLEEKRKFGDYISKTSASITLEEYRKILSGDMSFAITHSSPLLRRFYVEHSSFLLSPKVIVDYRREAFVCESGNVRVTFDRDIRGGIGSFDLFDEKIITVPALEPGQLIMEVKYDDFIPLGIKKLLTPGASVNMALSKYVLCRNSEKIYSGGLK